MMPPTPGGPATHAKKLIDYFSTSPRPSPKLGEGASATLFNFEKYKKFPSGIRHLLTFFSFLFGKFSFKNYDIIFALDGFTVALPAVLAGIILRKKVILRIGGDFIYENFLYIKEVNFENYYANFQENKKLMPWSLYVKYLVQKFVLENCYGIIFNTSWQKDIYLNHYNFKNIDKLFVIQNPVEEIKKEIFENVKLSQEFENAIKENKFIFTSITRDIPYKNLTRLKQVFSEISTSPNLSLQRRGEVLQVHLETTQGSHNSCLKRISLSRAYICASISDISPNQVQEALSLKIPVIISKYTGITKILQDAGVARVVDPFDINDIKNAVLDMCDENIWHNYKKNLENFKWPQNWDSLFKQYEEIILSN